ncbi:AAA family ATPase [Desulfolithobacter sp.]
MGKRQKIYVFFGLIASGKSTLARAWAEQHGFLYLNTDRVRKELAGLQPTERRPDGLGQGIYTPEFTRRTYDAMLARADEALRRGAGGVVLDGSYSNRGERDRVRELARRHGAELLFVLCYCSEEEVARRLALRARDPEAVSDGRWEIYLKQKEFFSMPGELAPGELLRLDTEADITTLLTRLEQMTSGGDGQESGKEAYSPDT